MTDFEFQTITGTGAYFDGARVFLCRDLAKDGWITVSPQGRTVRWDIETKYLTGFPECVGPVAVERAPEPEPEAPSGPEMPLTLTIEAERATVTGTIKGDPRVPVILPRPWVWSRTAGGYVLPRSLRPETRTQRIREFRRAAEAQGISVDVEDSGEEQSEAERREARAERLDVRAERHEVAAERAEQVSDAAYQASRAISDGIPMGQPILVGHHSERRHRRDLDRMQNLDQKSWDADREAKRREQLAAGIRASQERGDSPVTIANRIERNEADIRRIDRGSANPDARARLAEAVEIDKAALAELESAGLKLWSRTDFTKGDYASSRFGWHKVVRVNAKSLSVESGYSWTDTLPYAKVTGRRAAE